LAVVALAVAVFVVRAAATVLLAALPPPAVRLGVVAAARLAACPVVAFFAAAIMVLLMGADLSRVLRDVSRWMLGASAVTVPAVVLGLPHRVALLYAVKSTLGLGGRIVGT
jgi:hypothetical protein